RFALGLYAAVHFAQLTPWAAELFSNAGVVADASASPILHAFPNLLALHDGPGFVTALAGLATVLSVLVAVGLRDRWAAVALWYILACFLGRNPLILNPSLPHIGWLLLAHAAVPTSPRGSVDGRLRPDLAASWHLPRPLFAAGWVVQCAAYAYSGATKLVSPSWLDGTALRHILDNPLARPSALRDLALTLPDAVFAAGTWGALGLELAFPLLACSLRTRPWAWLAMLGMHLGLLLFVDFADLTMGMLVLQLFTFEPRWLQAIRWPTVGPSPQTSAAGTAPRPEACWGQADSPKSTTIVTRVTIDS
ncbi:MAG: hypothetical protein ACI8PZ_007096, partial [Myxococcota bacterium]